MLSVFAKILPPGTCVNQQGKPLFEERYIESEYDHELVAFFFLAITKICNAADTTYNIFVNTPNMIHFPFWGNHGRPLYILELLMFRNMQKTKPKTKHTKNQKKKCCYASNSSRMHAPFCDVDMVQPMRLMIRRNFRSKCLIKLLIIVRI